MKTKHTPKLIVLILSVMMIVSMFCVMTVSASAEETTTTTTAEIAGQQVNLGGDISMKYYVTLTSGSIEDVSLQITFLGEVSKITESKLDDETGKYVFTFTGIPPQCMGDTIYADVLVDGNKVGETVTYSVKASLVSIYNDSTDAQKQLIIDTLEYGAAAQVYAGYKTGALVTTGVDFLANDTNDVEEIPASFPTGTKEDGTTMLVEANVLFSYMNFLKFRFTPADIIATVTIGGEAADTWTDDLYFYAQATKGVEPFNFDEKYEVELGNINLSYSINDYCYAVSQKSNDDSMIALAEALYNYGRSAEALKHAENREHTNVTYVADGATIHATCPACGDIGSITLMNPESRVYDGTDKVVTYTGEIEYLTNITVNYEGDRKNVTQDGFTAYVEIDGVKAELIVKLEKANASVTIAPAANNDLTYSGSAQALVSAGSATGGKLVYSLSDTGEYTDMIPTGTNADNYTVWYKVVGDENHNDVAAQCVTVTIAKADQAPLTITGKPETVAYCDMFNLGTTGGSTGGSVTWAVTEGNLFVSSSGYVGVNGVGNFTITATMAGNDNYNDVTATWAGTSVKGTPLNYNAPTGVTATYGTKLSDVVLVNPTGNIDGTWSWMTEDENTLVGDVTADGNTFYAKFIPEDQNFNTMENIPVVIIVNKADPTYTAPTGLTATYGQTLADVTLPNGFAWESATTTAVGDVGTQSFTVKYTPTDTNNYNTISGIQVSIEVKRANASVTTAPAAKTNLVANGSALELVNEGSANGGTIEYALGTDATTAPTEGWSTSIPTGTTAGTYYVWYKVVGDANHNDVAAQCVTVTISDHVHVWTYEASGTTITATCSGEGTCPNKTATATITVNNGVYTGSAIKTVSVTPGENWEGEITIEYQNNVNVGTATAIIKVNGEEVTTVNFEIKKDPKTDEIDGEWVEIETP